MIDTPVKNPLHRWRCETTVDGKTVTLGHTTSRCSADAVRAYFEKVFGSTRGTLRIVDDGPVTHRRTA